VSERRSSPLLWVVFALLLVAIVLAVIDVGKVRQGGPSGLAVPTWAVLVAVHSYPARPD
jgi:hypothetical protein